MHRRGSLRAIVWTFVLTLAATLLVLNFTSGEKRLDEQVKREYALHDEANLNIYDEAFAAGQTAQFEADLRLSKRLTYEAWKDRPLREKAMEQVAALLSSQL